MSWKHWGGALLAMSAMDTLAAADQPEEVSSPYLELRYRDSTLHSDSFDNKGHAHTLRLQLGYLWAIGDGWDAYAEGTRVWSLFGHEYNDTSGRYTPYPAEADPQSTELSNAWVGYHGQVFSFRLGRQYLQLDNGRFFATNSWRQNPQSFDALTTSWQLAEGTVFSYDWLRQVNRTVGADFFDRTQRRWRLNGHLLRVEQTLPWGKLTGYGFWIRNDTAASNSVRTFGARWTGSEPVGYLGAAEAKLAWTLELANQKDYANNPNHYSLPYHLFEATYGAAVLSVRLGEELIGGNGHTALNVAYGSSHPFGGWVGEFKVPAGGLRDRYGGPVGVWPGSKISWQLTYHDFHSQNGQLFYGDEIDAGVLFPIVKRFSLEVQYGRYHAHSWQVNEHKLWLIAEYKFGAAPK